MYKRQAFSNVITAWISLLFIISFSSIFWRYSVSTEAKSNFSSGSPSCTVSPGFLYTSKIRLPTGDTMILSLIHIFADDLVPPERTFRSGIRCRAALLYLDRGTDRFQQCEIVPRLGDEIERSGPDSLYGQMDRTPCGDQDYRDFRRQHLDFRQQLQSCLLYTSKLPLTT